MKKKSIFTLVPPRVQFEDFWVEIRKRNLWLIKLRYGAVLMLTSLILGTYLLRIIYPDFYLYTLPHWIIASSILLYNTFFHLLWLKLAQRRDWFGDKGDKKDNEELRRFRSPHFSLLQICTDFIALILFIYFTGGIETPLFVLYIFHVIIGSLFLPGIVMSLIITTVFVASVLLTLLEYFSIIPHYTIQGLLISHQYDNIQYIIVFYIIFALALYLSTYLANSISKELYRRQRALDEAYKELEKAEKAKSKYLMSFVHDLKTPISAVITYLNMIMEDAYGKVAEEIRRPIERSIIRLNSGIDLINDILCLSSLKLGILTTEPKDINLVDLFNEILKDFRDAIQNKKINVNIKSHPAEIVTFKADWTILKLAFSNLISNSIKYTDEGGIVEIYLNDSHSLLTVSIADNGIGIPPGEKDKIFKDFYRSTISKKKGIEGTGLGMSVVIEALKYYNATIKIESPSYLKSLQDRPGTEFIIEFKK